ncbi:MAG: hypothetical protein AAF318_03195 [Pseudomonadota bacterium]
MRALLVALLVAAAPAAACETDGGAAHIAAHDGRLTLTLDDGMTVRLAALVPARDAAAAAPAIELSTLLGEPVSVRRSGPDDRWGRQVGDLLLARTGERLSHRLLTQGLALVDPAGMPSDCLDARFSAEAVAETRRVGVWATGFVADAADPRLAQQAGRFALVDGVVDSVGETKGTVYLNFGKAYRTDFTGLFSKRGGKELAKTLKGLAGKRVRVRGVLGAWQGGFIRVTHRRQIEVRSAD